MFTLKIDTDNAAFESDAAGEVARMLRDVAARLERGDHGHSQTRSIMDANGNRVGSYKLVAASVDRRGAPVSVKPE